MGIPDFQIVPCQEEDFPTFGQILAESFQDKMKLVFKNAFKSDPLTHIGHIFGKIGVHQTSSREISRNYILKSGSEVYGGIQLTFKGAEENYRAVWQIVKEAIGWKKALRAAFLLAFFERTPKDYELHIDAIATHPSHRGEGVGSKILSFVENLGKLHGFSEIVLEVIGKNIRAKELYERMGYVVRKTHKTYLGKKTLNIPIIYEMVLNLKP
jgi:ribosomal protein S18 acetylase RimI-like enzyme